MKNKLHLAVLVALTATGSAQATVWTETFDGSTTQGATATITFDDWGFTGPNGRTAQDFDPVNGFGNNALDPTGGIGQIQHVVTSGPDGLTADAPVLIKDDISAGWGYDVANQNVDSVATFYQWGYTSPADSTFNNMQIDYDGDYHIAKDDMSFSFYNTLETSGGDLANSLAFQPYALSDAKGWCGSIMAEHPNALEAMAGQVTFDFAFDVYFRISEGVYSYMSTEIVQGFEMRSYGDLTIVSETELGDVQNMSARAIVNNTNPEDPMYDAGNTPTIDENMAVDADFHNRVSFMGGDLVTTGSDASGNTGDCGILNPEWNQFSNSGPGVKKFNGLISGVADAAACTTAGGEWQAHAFAGYAFILRADADRYVDYFDESVYGADPMATPVPAAVWLFGSGLVGLIGVARRKKLS